MSQNQIVGLEVAEKNSTREEHKKSRKSHVAASALASALAASLATQAQAQDAQPTVTSTNQLANGDLQLVLSDGRTVVVNAADYQIVDARSSSTYRLSQTSIWRVRKRLPPVGALHPCPQSLAGLLPLVPPVVAAAAVVRAGAHWPFPLAPRQAQSRTRRRPMMPMSGIQMATSSPLACRETMPRSLKSTTAEACSPSLLSLISRPPAIRTATMSMTL
jgi:hypothetical protein